ncbi:hypothetical protein Q2941_37455 [Bradyrhizobium sp. UFLA05-153]|jgi:hypothetical protein
MKGQKIARTDPTGSVRHVDVCNALDLLGLLPGPRNKSTYLRVNALIMDRVKLGKVKKLGTGLYQVKRRRAV